MNTHGAFIQLPGGGHAFVDGIPDKCKHDGLIDDYFETASGKSIYWYTFRQWAGYISQYRNELIFEYQEKEGDPVVFMCGQCNKCKKILGPDLFNCE